MRSAEAGSRATPRHCQHLWHLATVIEAEAVVVDRNEPATAAGGGWGSR